MGANGFTEEENKRLILMFFKQIGLYVEFKEFMADQTIENSDKFRFSVHSDPLSVFGDTTVTSYLKCRKDYQISDDGCNLYDIFKAWLFAFYLEEYEIATSLHYTNLKDGTLENWIDVEKRCFKKKIIKKEI